MSVSQVITLGACAAQLALAFICVARAASSPLALPLALLCLDIFGWTGAGLAYQLSHVPSWRWLDHALTPWTAPLALHFVLLFVGRRREVRGVLYVACLAGGSLSVVCVLAFAMPSMRPFIGSPSWALVLMSVALPPMAFAIFALLRHLRESVDSTERARTLLLLAAASIGTALGATEELGRFVGVPPLGDVGMLAITAPLSLVALRFRLFQSDVSLRAAAYVVSLTGGSVLALFAVFHYLDANAAMAVLGLATVSLALGAASRRWLTEGANRRSRQVELTTLGRFSAQMAHDLKNPLAALKGAAQLLCADLAQATAGVDRVAFAHLMLEQIDRLNRLVDVYARLAQVEPEREPLDLNELARTVLALQSFAIDPITVQTELDDGLPRCSGDREMLARVLENLVRNAIEAMPEGGTVTVRTMHSGTGPARSVAFSVQDTGSGMDARTRERAFDDFFTTKPHGSGLGLAFARRVVEAHQGEMSLESEQGRGTVVRVRLPVG
jgi:two-component system, NtrC family, sensor histidine kinase HydH